MATSTCVAYASVMQLYSRKGVLDWPEPLRCWKTLKFCLYRETKQNKYQYLLPVGCLSNWCFPNIKAVLFVVPSFFLFSVFPPQSSMDYQIDLVGKGQCSASQGLITGYGWKAIWEPEGHESQLLSLLCYTWDPVGFHRPFIICLGTVSLSDKARGNLQSYGLGCVYVVSIW